MEIYWRCDTKGNWSVCCCCFFFVFANKDQEPTHVSLEMIIIRKGPWKDDWEWCWWVSDKDDDEMKWNEKEFAFMWLISCRVHQAILRWFLIVHTFLSVCTPIILLINYQLIACHGRNWDNIFRVTLAAVASFSSAYRNLISSLKKEKMVSR